MLDTKYLCEVLVIDDDPDVRVFVAEHMMSLGCATVNLAQNGKEALRLMQSKPIKLVISDLQMPEMDGIELIRRLAKANYRGGILFVSACTSDLVEAAAKVANSYSIKFLGGYEKSAITPDVLKQIMIENATITKPIKLALKTKPRREDLENALRQEAFDFVALPSFSLVDKSIHSYELLTRWSHSRIGDVPPELFVQTLLEIPELAKQYHQMVWRAGMKLLAKLNQRSSMSSTYVSVNMPLSAFEDPAVCDEIIKDTQIAGVEPKGIRFELNDHNGHQNHALVLEVLTRLRLLGFHLSLDDFGRATSNMDMLLELPISELKIDAQFVFAMATERLAYHFIKSTIEIAKASNIAITAEGVESPMQWNLLKKLQCDYAQGYYLSEPLPLTAVDQPELALED